MRRDKLSCFMLIDDNEADNVYHEIVINEAECVEKVVPHLSAEDALEALKNVPSEDCPVPNIIFLDINMPGMNGWEFLEEYQKLAPEHQADIVVVMLTTSLNPDDRERAAQIDLIKDFKTKPLSPDKLDDILEKFFRERQK